MGGAPAATALAVARDHPAYEGHFPGNPIVPGVCTIAIIKELLEKALEKKLVLKESKAVKFLGLINPAMSPKVTLAWKEEGDHINASATLHEGPTALFKMSAQYISAVQ